MKVNKKNPTKFKTAKVLTHYSSDDSDCYGDYYDIELFLDGKLVATFGDYYHDKGSVRVKAFIQGVEFAQGTKLKTEYVNVADRE